ncbi:hypothetical protein [Streptomyces chromofuscus]|uniref:Uncharacterized protein n=1 Tax=Streptomyces chromofuscus TaxID=42881 RepID=A0A7M2SZG9_STRCW|nr:hypothetical protein [Streptomyces chromofuscus]QOV41787.1 hypothetical protein IPT68_17910 [Streptomyces chromofuscus]GGS88417.1 hypothetical protein GCM10010254_05380 [Streptomyces chromofuscus]
MSLTRVVLSSGRSIELTELRMSSTYGGMLEGHPCEPVNDMKINALVRGAERAYPTTRVHLIPPPREYPDEGAGAFGPVEVLPAVGCVGAFHSTSVDEAHDPVQYRSRLTVVWFQATPDVPSGHEADAGLLGLAWERLAQDYEL